MFISGHLDASARMDSGLMLDLDGSEFQLDYPFLVVVVVAVV